MSAGLEWSKGKRRVKVPRLLGKAEGVKELPSSEDTEPIKDAKTGRFVKGNHAYRRRVLKRKARGIVTLDPASCAAWLRPHVVDGASYGMDLIGRFSDPVLARLAGNVADAHTVYRALLAQGVGGDVEALREARAWFREHRSGLATLSALAGEKTGKPADERFYIDVEEGEGGK